MKTPALPAALLALGLGGCGLLPQVGPDYRPPGIAAPAAWQAPLPHGGDPAELADWWRQWDDPLLAELIKEVEAASPSLPQAWARIQQSRSELVDASAADRPSLDASVGASRSAVSYLGPAIPANTRSASLMSNWEIDLFGGIARRQEGAAAGFSASQQRWHEARVSLAAETAQTFLQIRYLESRLHLADADLASRRESARLTRSLAQAGLQTNEAAALEEAGAAEAAAAHIALQADYDQQIKALVALSGIAEPDLRARLAARRGRFPKPREFRIESLPAGALAQRPDLAAAERDVATASAAIGQAESWRYPKLQLQGNLTPLRMNIQGSSINANTWSIGAGLTMPLVDGGRIDAKVDAARAEYAAAAAQYRQKARDAVREVEQALVRLDAAGRREADLHRAVEGYHARLAASRTRQKAGLAGPLELELASRMTLAAEVNLAAWQREQGAAWVDLYRAVGGGWKDGSPIAPPTPPDQTGGKS